MDGDFRDYEVKNSPKIDYVTDFIEPTVDQSVQWQRAYARFQQLLREQDFYHAGEILEYMEKNACPIILLAEAWREYVHSGIAHHLSEAEDAKHDFDHPKVFKDERAAALNFMEAGLSQFGILPDPDLTRRLNNLPSY